MFFEINMGTNLKCCSQWLFPNNTVNYTLTRAVCLRLQREPPLHCQKSAELSWRPNRMLSVVWFFFAAVLEVPILILGRLCTQISWTISGRKWLGVTKHFCVLWELGHSLRNEIKESSECETLSCTSLYQKYSPHVENLTAGRDVLPFYLKC